MKTNILLFLLSLIIFSVAEKFEKVNGTSGEYADIVVDSNNRWYIIKDKTLYYSLDKGKTLTKIEVPSKELVHKRLGVDKFDNIYVQDDKMSVFLVAPSVNETFVFEEITLVYGKEKLVSRPISFGYNDVYFATKSGIMNLRNSETETRKVPLHSKAKKDITQMVSYSSTDKYFAYRYDGMFYSAGNPKYGLFEQHDFYPGKSIVKSDNPLKSLNAINDHIYCVEMSQNNKMVVVIFKRESAKLVEIKNIDVSNIDDNDFVIHSPRHDNRTYVYTNIDNTGTLYRLDETDVIYGSREIKIASTHKLDNVLLLSAVLDNDMIYFGTSNGVYQLTDIQS